MRRVGRFNDQFSVDSKPVNGRIPLLRKQMNLVLFINQIVATLWYLVPLGILAAIIQSAWFKGVAGEFIVNLSIKLSLDKEQYHLVKNITLPTEDGSTQIDHVIISKYGVFVIETKNIKGWIFGNANQKQWTQQIYKHKNKFQNPLHQNYKHTKVLGNLLGLNDKQLFSVIVFVGDSTFKTTMPDNVTYGRDCIRYIKLKNQLVLTDAEVAAIKEKIQLGRLTPSLKTNRDHVKHVKSIKEAKENSRNCPNCRSVMIRREVQKGANIGKKFWGCSNFPKCKGIINDT